MKLPASCFAFVLMFFGKPLTKCKTKSNVIVETLKIIEQLTNECIHFKKNTHDIHDCQPYALCYLQNSNFTLIIFTKRTKDSDTCLQRCNVLIF